MVAGGGGEAFTPDPNFQTNNEINAQDASNGDQFVFRNVRAKYSLHLFRPS